MVFHLKCLFQVCVDKVQWDQTISDSNLNEWALILSDLGECCVVDCERWYGDYSFSVVELHGFADASCKGYGCCVYLRFIVPSGHCHTALVSSQSWVAPLKTPTIPRLELQADTHIDTVYKHLSYVIPIINVFCWSDSTITLSWIENSSKVNRLFRLVWKRFILSVIILVGYKSC